MDATYRGLLHFPRAWPEQEFQTHKVSLVNGEQVSLQLAERGVRLSNDLWVGEVRTSEKRTPELILSTDFQEPDVHRPAFRESRREVFLTLPSMTVRFFCMG